MAIRSPIKNRFDLFRSSQDRTILLVCMAISLFFWALVKLSKTYTTTMPVKVVTMVQPDQALRQLPPDDIMAEVEGTGWALVSELFSEGAARLEVNLTNGKSRRLESAQLRSAVKEELGGGREMQVLNLNYNELRFDLEPRLRKKVPVVLPIKLNFAPDHQLQSPVSVRPDSVTITGPESKVKVIVEWPLDSLVLSQLTASVTKQITTSKSSNQVLQVTPKAIEVEIPVETTTQKSFFVDLYVANSPEDSLNMYPRQVRVSCTVGLSRFEEVSPEDFRLVLDLADVPVSENKRTAPIQLVEHPDFVRNISFSPKSAEFFIIKPGKEEK